MELHEALQLVEVRLGISLNDNERDLLRGVLEGLDGTQIHSQYFDGRIQKAHLTRNVAPKLWKKLGNAFGEKVGMRNLRGPLERARSRFVENSVAVQQPSIAVNTAPPVPAAAQVECAAAADAALQDSAVPTIHRVEPLQDWGRSPRVVNFCGRRDMLQQVETRLRIGGCQMFAICGEAGVGKTWFAKQLSQQLIDHYDTVVWRTLDPHRPVEIGRLLADLVSTITRKSFAAPVSIAHFLEVLMNHPSLIVLDGIEAVLAEGVSDGSYKPGLEDYATLLWELSRRSHYSCVLVVGREKPRVFSEQSGNPLVCNLSLRGFDILETKELFQARGCKASPALWRRLNHLCDGNPKALQLMDEMLMGSCAGDVEIFLDVYEQPHERTLNDQRIQFNRLSPLEQEILYKLSQLELRALNLRILKDMDLDASFRERQQAHQSLIHRSLLRQCDEKPSDYIMSSLMREYALDNVVAQSEKSIEPGLEAGFQPEFADSSSQKRIKALTTPHTSESSLLPSLVGKASAP